MSPTVDLRTFLLTILAMLAFAANSVLCRLALGGQTIDAAAFTGIRLVSGAIMLALLLLLPMQGDEAKGRGSWRGAAMLFLYAICFSYAYLSLSTGTGALVLFGAVQITMILVSVIKGGRLSPAEWTGTAVAFAGFVYLVLPGVSAPPLSGFLLMAVAGMAWGLYSLFGRNSANPLMDTASNFIRTLPLVVVLALVTWRDAFLTAEGIVLAILSGAITSGIGYAIWYSALRQLTATRAAVVQLSVPVIAAVMGILFVGEAATARLLLAGMLVLGGILMVIRGRQSLRPDTAK